MRGQLVLDVVAKIIKLLPIDTKAIAIALFS